ncbi:MAG: glycosyltransferase family protein [Gammaproteobacteria bacterium]|nr:MAG: glycosyltransferase family protein [Gammaproteobacteria bacterium]
MPKTSKNKRVLIYSHDSFGLGHLRRCRKIAHSLVARRKAASVLILSGSPIIGSFDFRTRVDFVRVPGVIKLRNGEYSSLSLHMDIAEVLQLRAAIIRHTAEVFAPDLLIVDKEPLGLRGEIHDTLRIMKGAGTRLVLGLRDVMDDPQSLAAEWERKNPLPALSNLYDDILVYGLPEIYDPLSGIDLPDRVRAKITYTGYLSSRNSTRAPDPQAGPWQDRPYVLVTPGGGRDGEDLVDWLLSAYETGAHLPHAALVVFGPFMRPKRRKRFLARIERLPLVRAITFDNRLERLMAGATGVVAMGGYNTFCEILTFDKPAVLVPRRHPRAEQYIRAARAERLGLVRMLSDVDGREPERMADALRALPAQRRPSDAVVPGLLDGLDRIHDLTEQWLDEESGLRPLALA